MTEDQLEQETLVWLGEVGYNHLHGPAIAPDGENPERVNYQQVLLPFRLREAIHRLNPEIPTAAKEDALKQVMDLGIPALLTANRHFHKLLVGGVPVQYQKDGETRGDFVRLIDWAESANAPKKNEWLAVNQFSIKGPHHTRRPDIILFVNGLPLVLLELKNPADEKADIWKAFDQIQTYKAQIPDVFQYNELLVIADGTEARLGSLSASAERFMQWRTIDGVTLDPLGQFSELETLVRGLLAPAMLLDYLRFFVLFEDDGTLVKKVAGYHQFHAVRAAIQQVVLSSRPGGTRKGGVVWHTQGSGKSITMTCFAARVMQETAMENPTIVVITDRNDLDGQLFGVFSLAQDLLREQPVQANTRQDLRAKLGNRPSGGIVFATIQKFMPGEDEDTFPVLSERSNIVVIADEAHRTQYGFEAKLKMAGFHGRPWAMGKKRRTMRRCCKWQNRLPNTPRPIRSAMPSICAMRCLTPPSLPSPAPRFPAKTATPGRCSAITSTSTTCSRPRRMAPQWPSTSSHGWPSYRSSRTNCQPLTMKSMNWPRTRKKASRPS
jgi:type I restriction enzyme R subunit